MSPVHFFILSRIADWLNGHVFPAHLTEVYSPAKDEVLFHFRRKGDFYLHMVCSGALPGLRLPATFNRPRRNTTDIFTGLSGSMALEAGVVPFDRLLWVRMEDGTRIIYKCFPRHANVLHLDSQSAILSRFRQELDPGDSFPIVPGKWDPELAFQDGESAAVGNLKKISGIWDKDCQTNAELLIGTGMPIRKVIDHILDQGLHAPLRMGPEGGMPVLSPFEKGNQCLHTVYPDVREALSAYTVAFYRVHEYSALYESVGRDLARSVQKAKGLLQGALDGIEGLENERSAEELGNLVISNLHRIQPGQKVLEVIDYYTEKKIRIRLRPEMNGLENAEVYFRKHKKRREQIRYLKLQLEQKQKDLFEAESRHQAFLSLPVPATYPWQNGLPEDGPLRKLRAFVRDQSAAGPVIHMPFRSLEVDGFHIRYGTNAKMNDQLTLHHTHKEDYWLHARDVAGAHVVICHRSGMNPPASVVEAAAGIAAFLSKRRTEALVPVTFTRKKFVRKRKGMAQGEVEVTREDIVMAVPLDPLALQDRF